MKVNDDKVMMMEMRAKVDADIETWEKQFEKENGRPPTEADRYGCLVVEDPHIN